MRLKTAQRHLRPTHSKTERRRPRHGLQSIKRMVIHGCGHCCGCRRAVVMSHMQTPTFAASGHEAVAETVAGYCQRTMLGAHHLNIICKNTSVAHREYHKFSAIGPRRQIERQVPEPFFAFVHLNFHYFIACTQGCVKPGVVGSHTIAERGTTGIVRGYAAAFDKKREPGRHGIQCHVINRYIVCRIFRFSQGGVGRLDDKTVIAATHPVQIGNRLERTAPA